MRWRGGATSAGRAAAQLALLPLAAFAVHQLRYLLAFGGHAGAVLAQTGHSYLSSVAPWIVLPVALAAGAFLRAIGRAFGGHTTARRYSLSLAGLWVACTLTLLAVFICQELLEGMLLVGHPAGFVGVFGFGGWWAIPSAVAVGLVLAALLHGALWVLHEVTRIGAARREPARRARAVRLRLAEPFVGTLDPLVEGWSGRGPPRVPVRA